jgi:ribosomal protein L10
MAVSREQKAAILEELVVKFKEAKSIGFATTNTMTVSEFYSLRTNLREV